MRVNQTGKVQTENLILSQKKPVFDRNQSRNAKHTLPMFSLFTMGADFSKQDEYDYSGSRDLMT